MATEPNVEPCGLLNLDKPVGMSSRDAVNRIVHALRQLIPKPARLPKVGHAGTLDPLASGVLIVGVGPAVRLVPYLHQLDKSYEATFRLGQSSPSGDLETPLVEEPNPARPTHEQLLAAARSLVGNITQIPPAHSAIKVDGRKAYRSAHRGQAVEIPPRIVRIESLELTRYDYPEVDLLVRCGTGTYIRTLGIDLARACGTTAVMTRLTRTRIGEFQSAGALAPERFAKQPDEILTALQPLVLGVPHLPRVILDDNELVRLGNGLRIELTSDAVQPPLTPCRSPIAVGTEPTDDEPTEQLAILDQSNNLRAIGTLRHHRLHAHRVFPPPPVC